MLANPGYVGIDLPVYEADAPVIAAPSEADIQNLSGEHFLRGVQIYLENSRHATLAKVLKTTDEQLDELATRCDIDVVDHEWALWRRPYNVIGQHNLLPDKHSLIARVAIIDAFDRTPEVLATKLAIEKQVRANYFRRGIRGRLRERRPLLWDTARLDQYVIGTNRAQADKTGKWLVDIEPRLNKV